MTHGRDETLADALDQLARLSRTAGDARDGTRGTRVDAFCVYAGPPVNAALANVPIRVDAVWASRGSTTVTEEPGSRERQLAKERDALRDRLAAAEAAGAEQRRLLDELGAPLSIVLSRLELMLTELDDRAVPPTLAEDLAVLHRHTERMVCLLETLRARRLSWPDP